MKKTLFAFAAAALCQVAFAQGIRAENAVAVSTVKGQDSSGAYVRLTNTDKQDDTLIGVSVPKNIADRAELHTHYNDNGVMRMREVKDGVPLPAGKTQELKRGSYHIMFFGLKKQLVPNEKFKLTLKYKRNKPQVVPVTVKMVQETMPQQNHDAMPHDHQMQMTH